MTDSVAPPSAFRHLPLPEALAVITELGFAEIDLGALPGVCDHVPYLLDRAAVTQVAAEVARTGLRVRSVNGDIGDLNAILDEGQRAERSEHLDRLLDLTAAVNGVALVLPTGALHHDPMVDEITDIARVAADVHLRDATPGNIHHSIGNGSVDFAVGLAALETACFTGHFTLELETRDITHEERPAAAGKAAAYISSLL